MATQFGPEDKTWIPSFSYAKAIIKDDVTYPIVSNCPIINNTDNAILDVSNIPVGAFFIIHSPDGDGWNETLCIRVSDATTFSQDFLLEVGYISIASRGKSSSIQETNLK